MPIRCARSHLKFVFCALGAMMLLCVVPAMSSAAEIVVNTTHDRLPEGEEVCTGGPVECTLRDAIEKANEDTDSSDTITFTPLEVGETLEVEGYRLPPIYGPVVIEGDTAHNATAGVPALELEPVGFEDGTNYEPGFTVLSGEGTRIEGFAIGGFGFGIEVGPEEDTSSVGTEICGDYIGTDLSGEIAEPNGVGVEIRRGEEESEWPTETIVGNGTTCAGNVIAGNTGYGISDEGMETTIAGNAIGIGSQPDGVQLPNGSGGILESTGAKSAMIGGVEPEAVKKGNFIAFNEGPGVRVESGLSEVAIRHDYFEENLGKGIEIEAEAPPAPSITSNLSAGAGQVTIRGIVEAKTPGENVELEFFGSEDCSREGEGRTYLGSDLIEDVTKPVEYATTLFVEVPADEHGLTATATGSVAGQTSEFSECFLVQAPPGSRTFLVNSLEDNPGAEGCEAEAVCTLRGAIEAADETEPADTIDFAVTGVIKIGSDSSLPSVTEPIEIDGTTAPGYAGSPLVLIDGIEAGPAEGGGSEGLVIASGAGASLIKGIAVGGFGYGVSLDGSLPSRLCSSWIGVELDGTTSLGNEVGIETGSVPVGNEIGAGCGAEGGNTISGNNFYAIRDEGRGTEISGNQIGVDPAGGVMPNGLDHDGGGGIEELENASGALIEGNTIAYNLGPGVSIGEAVSRTQVRANSIFGNEGKGIVYEVEEEAPGAPTITSVTGEPGSLAVAGQVTVGDDEHVELDFYASAICSPLSAGVGETYLGTKTLDITPASTKSYAETLGVPISDDELYITVTSTGTGSEQTSEFSECFKYVPPEPEPEPEHHEEPKTPVQNNVVTLPSPPPVEGPIPKNGEKVIVKPEEGKVLIKLPGTKKYVPLKELKEIPVGAVIDATKGRVKLTSIDPDGTEQTAEFFGGVFRVKQREGGGLVVLELLDTNVCPAPQSKGAEPRAGARASSIDFRPKSATAGKLWGSGHGNFQTEGNDGSATVRGTIWLVEDRCDGTTFFKTRRGIVSVRDFIKHKTLPLPAGNTYLAGEG